MKPLATAPNLVEQVRDALLNAIATGALAPGARVVQERVAEQLGVSRQPVQQALTLLLSHGVLQDAPGRRLVVKPLDPVHLRRVYDLRAAVEGVAFREAARHGAERAAREGPALIAAGRAAAATGAVPALIAADMRFHGFIHALADNPLLPSTLAPHWPYLQRVMGQVLQRSGQPRDSWNEHAQLLDAVAAGDADSAERLAREHVTLSADFMVARLHDAAPAPAAD